MKRWPSPSASAAACHRHDISEPRLEHLGSTASLRPRQIGPAGTGQPPASATPCYGYSAPATIWLDLLPDYGCPVHRRFLRWRQKSVWAQLLEALVDAPDLEWLMIDASHKADSVSF